MGEFSLTHILIVLILFLVFFGPKRLPQMGQSLGEAIRGFKDAMNADPNKDQNQARQQASQPTPPPPAQTTHPTNAKADALNEAPAAHNFHADSTESKKDPTRQS